MAATQAKGHEEEKHTGMQEKIRKKRKTKTRKQGTKASKRENPTQGVSIATNLPRLCYKAETGTLPHDLSSPCSRRQRYQVSLLPLSSPSPREQINENQTQLPGLWGCSNSGSNY